MSKAEILASLGGLSVQERSEVLAQLIQLEEQEHPTHVSEQEAQLLDRELEDFEADPGGLAPWDAVRARLRARG